MSINLIFKAIYRSRVAILCVLLSICLLWGVNQCKQREKADRNINTLVTGNKIALELNKKTLVSLYDSICELAKELSIRPKTIRTVIQVPYIVHDSVNRIVKQIDTVNDKINIKFDVIGDCFRFNGGVIDTNIYFSDIKWHDNLTALVYVEKPQWIKIGKFVNWKKFWKTYNFNSKVYSECKGDTLACKTKIIR